MTCCVGWIFVGFLACGLGIAAGGEPQAAAAEPKPASKPKQSGDHWGVDAVGFRWTESDSVDDRWN